ncbi:MAG: GNAT family N-acetyltransferase [Vallitalea sp.]|nr:GNAT family N-acetyltransferase [Vallitalea sp.]
MEHIKIDNKIYGYAVNFKDNKEIRTSFNSLTRKTYGFDFEEWYQNGYWKDKYIPYALLDGEKVISNVSVNIIDFLVMGEKKRCIQIGTVMTDVEYRNQGLSKFIMEKVLEEWKDKCDMIYLFANDSVLDFYPKFRFRPANEYQHSININSERTTSTAKRLNMSDEKDRSFLINTIRKSLPVSKLAMCDKESLIMFYCTSFMKQNVYYIESLDTIVIADYDENILYLNDVFSLRDVSLDDIIAAMVNKEIRKIVFGFTPVDTTSYDVNLLIEEDTTLFVMGDKVDFFKNKQIMFPLLSHA